MEINTALTEMYVRQGVLDIAKKPVHLPTDCPRSPECWAEIQDRSPKPGECAGEISSPYIGDRYDEGRLLLVLENLRDYGGFEGMRILGREAREGFRRGSRKLFKGDSYAGTDVWYKAVSYAACWLDAQGILTAKWNRNGDVETETLHDAMDYLAIVQHVKCSPKDHRSKPSAAMWNECGPHLLVHELQILRPACMIVFGTSRNATALHRFALSGVPVDAKIEQVKSGRKLQNMRYEKHMEKWGEVAELVIPHPASFGGNSGKLLKAVRRLLGNA